jgi:hypothetical protein
MMPLLASVTSYIHRPPEWTQALARTLEKLAPLSTSQSDERKSTLPLDSSRHSCTRAGPSLPPPPPPVSCSSIAVEAVAAPSSMPSPTPLPLPPAPTLPVGVGPGGAAVAVTIAAVRCATASVRAWRPVVIAPSPPPCNSKISHSSAPEIRDCGPPVADCIQRGVGALESPVGGGRPRAIEPRQAQPCALLAILDHSMLDAPVEPCCSCLKHE